MSNMSVNTLKGYQIRDFTGYSGGIEVNTFLTPDADWLFPYQLQYPDIFLKPEITD